MSPEKRPFSLLVATYSKIQKSKVLTLFDPIEGLRVMKEHCPMRLSPFGLMPIETLRTCRIGIANLTRLPKWALSSRNPTSDMLGDVAP